MAKYRKKREYHGGTETRLYNVHRNMMERCFNPECKDFPHYGGRGITVDPCLQKFADYRKWFHRCFREADVPRDMTVDRINNDGSYEPSNLRLATMKEQQNNRRSNKLVTFQGETHTISEWSHIVSIPRKTLEKRLGKYGWTTEQALTTPAKQHWQWIEHEGEKKTINEWSDHLGISASTIRHRLKKGLSANQALAV